MSTNKETILGKTKYKSIHFVDEAHSRLWYKGWACIIDNNLYIGRRLSIINLSKEHNVKYFPLNKGVYTNNPKRIRLK